ncbi:MAG: nucleotide exchange factor GrpE [Bacteroidetes bacterium]|nr:nucleotide exchange factor GrpE [Bacteroidota bacterium]
MAFGKKKENKEKMNQTENQENENLELQNESSSTNDNDSAGSLTEAGIINELVEQINNLNAEIEKQKSEIDNLRDILQRRVAEIDNIKRRHREESAKTWTDAEGNLISALLPVIDNFDRAAEFAPKTEDKEKVIQGFILIHDSLAKMLEQKGLKQIPAKGQPFDYNLHNAIGRYANSEVEPDTVLEVVTPGYMYKDTILRHSDVIISEMPEAPTDDSTKSEEEEK